MELKDLSGVEVIAWAFAAGATAGIARRLLLRERVTWRHLCGEFLAAGLMGIVAAMVSHEFRPNSEGFWLPVAILVGFSGTKSINVSTRLMWRTVEHTIQSASAAIERGRKDKDKEQGDD